MEGAYFSSGNDHERKCRMKQIEYMDLMDYCFRNSDPLVYKEIRKDFEEHFRQALEEGKKEEEIVRELGDPKVIYEEYKAEGLLEESSRFDFSIFTNLIEEMGEVFNKKKCDTSLVDKEWIVTDQIHRIEILSEGFDIKMRNHKENYIKINYKSEENTSLPIQVKDAHLKIGSLDANRFLKSGEISCFKDLECYIPEDCDMGIHILAISGRTNLSVLHNDVTIRTGKGEIFCETKGDNVTIDAALANVKVKGDQKEIYIKTAAGNIDINSRTPTMDVNTISGKVAVKILRSKKMKIRSISSDIHLNMAELKGRAWLSSMSGEIMMEKKYKESSKKYGKSMKEIWSEEDRTVHLSSVSGNIFVDKL